VVLVVVVRAVYLPLELLEQLIVAVAVAAVDILLALEVLAALVLLFLNTPTQPQSLLVVA
jgi:hypothetical protein